MNEKDSIAKITQAIKELSVNLKKDINLMEVCGTHTMAISRFGIRSMLPPEVRLISGPGCPVCVTPIEEVDRAIEISAVKDVIITTFGDMMRVPGTKSNLLNEKAQGRDIRVVYSPLDALEIAKQNPAKNVVFLGIGFETTSPSIALTVMQAEKTGLSNFSVLPQFKVIIPPMEALLRDKELNLNGFIAPGHASTIVGGKTYEYITEKYKVPCVVTGFEPADILSGIHMLVSQIVKGESKVEIQYKRAVKYEGNETAQKVLEEVFEHTDSNWRGIGLIPLSGLTLKKEYGRFNARDKFEVDILYSKEPPGCRCGDVLKGKCAPDECPLFGKTCTTENPVGACMVSSEGSCAAYYKYSGNL